MARNIPSTTVKDNTNPHAPARADNTSIPGGSSGIVIEGGAAGDNRAATQVGGPRVAPGRFSARAEEKPAKRFRVTGGPRIARDSEGRPVGSHIEVMYEGVVTRITIGKEYLEHQVDIGALKRQGVTFQEIAPPEEAAEAAV